MFIRTFTNLCFGKKINELYLGTRCLVYAWKIRVRSCGGARRNTAVHGAAANNVRLVGHFEARVRLTYCVRNHGMLVPYTPVYKPYCDSLEQIQPRPPPPMFHSSI